MHTNSSRAYYISNENVSDIKESLDGEYSMNFEQLSNTHSRSQITQMISGSHQVTQSRNQFKPKPLPKPPIIEEEQQQQNDGMLPDHQQSKPIFLGDHVYNNIKERYFQTNKITTEDPEVLYDFYSSQRKTMLLKGGKPFIINQKEMEKLMPSMQRKMLIKMNFQKILTYYPNDVYYSLCVQAEKLSHDRQLTHKAVLLSEEMNKNKKKKKTQKQIDQMVLKLYHKKGEEYDKKPKEVASAQVEKKKRMQFGKNLSEVFQNAFRERGQPANIQTLNKLHSYWEDVYERQEYGIEWDDESAKQTIKQYMYEQVEDLLRQASRKLGFKSDKAGALRNFYMKSKNIENIYIPLNSFQEYLKLYNEVQGERASEAEKKAKQNKQREESKRKHHEIKKFGRPVSATPITILSKPKNHHDDYETLMEKFPNDRLVKNLVGEENLKRPRYPFEYGMYHIEDQIKTKQWIKPEPKKTKTKYDETINKMLFQTYSNPQFFKTKDKDQLMEIFGEDYIQTDQHWKELGPLMHEAMLVKAYENHWFVDCILKYLERTFGQNYKVQTNTVIFKKLFKHLNELDEDKRKLELEKLENLILTSEQIAQKAEKIDHLAYKGDNFDKKDKRLLFSELEDKAIEFVRKRMKKTEAFQLRKFLNEMFEQLYKQHREIIKKKYHVCQNNKHQPQQKQCPKLLKYEFFRIVKEINPITLERGSNAKSHAWVPTKGVSQAFNYKTFNNLAQAYTKNKNRIQAKQEQEKYKDSLWGRTKGKDREKLMMTYNDAKECTFQPKISKKFI